ncbi:transmembrane amino acid transporter protein-domain-containing protein [Endogone sp. FLAS-F59071]|nr:transmembrane amino acid transporter protein-domain-containing protein [Endogone sp. FLAS-F59071]|eukprot:RUS18205.1 transmembrane amino acid transporter protein-domain-containing protein [Endogone sp. FLAS-F59071]
MSDRAYLLYDPPVPDANLVNAIEPHLVVSNSPPSPTSTLFPDQEEPSGPIPFHLQGASITNDIYKMHNNLTKSTIPRSRSEVGLPNVLNADPILENVSKPGGFRRFFYHNLRSQQQTPEPSPPSQPSSYQSFPDQELFEEGATPGQPKRTRHFLEWLAINYIFDRFAGEDLSESEGEGETNEDLPSSQPPIFPTERAPLIHRRSSAASELSSQVKATTGKSFFLLLKAFIGTGILFLPKAFSNGGMLFSALFLWFVAGVSFFAFLLLLQCKKEIPGSFGDIGGELYGKGMRRAVLFSIAISQIGFVCGASIFIAENLQLVILTVSNGALLIPTKTLLFGQALFLTPLVLIRNIARLSFSAVVSDTLIITGLTVLLYFDLRKLFLSSPEDTPPSGFLHHIAPGPGITWTINPTYYPVFIGTAVYSFEGIGLVIPIRDAMLHPDRFPAVLAGVMTLVALTLCLVGGLGYAAFGSDVRTVALFNLPPGPLVSTIQCLYALAIILSGPLTLFPAIRIVEQAIFGHRTGKHDWRVKWQKNALRIGVVVACMVIAYLGLSDLDKFISLIGSVCCTPLSFIFPPLFHLKAVAKTRTEKILDIMLCTFGIIVMVFTMSVTVGEWAKI